MNRIEILDCTLRDGGYCNEWKFGNESIEKIYNGLMESGIDIIECGFITNRIKDDPDISKYQSIKSIRKYLPPNRNNNLFVAMINYGEYDSDQINERSHDDLDGIRLAFHKNNVIEALEFAKVIKDKGYKLFLQPMVSLAYSDDEFLELIRRCNSIKPFAFYIVDSFGVMKRKDLIRLFYMVEHNLNEKIAIGFHSHNNLQLAFSNAQTLVDIKTKHDLIIDCCVYGMGRGAGNLNTELFVEYLNDVIEADYKIKPLLTIIDEILDKFYQQNYWGYSLPNYLSASNNTHPNYAAYLNDKHTLTVEQISDIFELIDDDKRVLFDKEHIEVIYQRYLSRGFAQDERLEDLDAVIKDKKILLIAPGKSSVDEKEKIISFAKEKDVISVSINYDYPFYDSRFIFLSNLRRYKELSKDKREKCIVTSNIPAQSFYLKTDYSTLLNMHEMARDNAGMMAIKFFIARGVKEIVLAGMDGYSHDAESNFGDNRMSFVAKSAIYDAMNKGITEALVEFSKDIKISFLTKAKYLKISE